MERAVSRSLEDALVLFGMIDWGIIAKHLTTKLKEEGLLPKPLPGEEYLIDRVVYITTQGKYGQFRLAHEECFVSKAGPRYYNVLCDEISKAEVLRKVWEVLTEEEKTLIMTETLGNHGI